MITLEILAGWVPPDAAGETHIPKYSTTGDILSYQRCRRQYGYFHVRGFASATATQRYFGVLVHDVLDRIHRNFVLNPVLPDGEEVHLLVQQAHDRLIRSGVRPYNATQQREQAARLIYRFVLLVGPHFFPHVKETEYHLERALKAPNGRAYILDGIVDVLSGAVSHAMGLSFSTEAEDVEIWDYKSGQRPDKESREMKAYEYQMRVYAELYRLRTGEYPARCVLVFVGDLGNEKLWAIGKDDPSKFPGLFYVVHPHPKHIGGAMAVFHETVEQIEAEKALPYPEQWQAPQHPVDPGTCEVCELRYNCASFPEGAKLRQDPL